MDRPILETLLDLFEKYDGEELDAKLDAYCKEQIEEGNEEELNQALDQILEDTESDDIGEDIQEEDADEFVESVLNKVKTENEEEFELNSILSQIEDDEEEIQEKNANSITKKGMMEAIAKKMSSVTKEEAIEMYKNAFENISEDYDSDDVVTSSRKMSPKTRKMAVEQMVSTLRRLKKEDVIKLGSFLGINEVESKLEENNEVVVISQREVEYNYDSENDVQALSEGEELTEDFKNKAKVIFETAVKTKVNSVLAEEIDKLEEEYQLKLEEQIQNIQNDLVNNISNYFDYAVEEWMNENKLAIEDGIKTEITENFINGLKSLFEENYVEIPEEKVDMVEELFAKVEELEDKLNESVGKNIEFKKELSEMKKGQIVSIVGSDLSDSDFEKFSKLTENVSFSDEEELENKLSIIKENYFLNQKNTLNEEVKAKPVTDSISEEFENDDTQESEVISESMQSYLDAIKKTLK